MAYFSNSTDGDVLYQQCENCPLNANPDENHCEVLIVQELFNYDQVRNEKLREAMSILVADDGTCRIRARAMAGKES